MLKKLLSYGMGEGVAKGLNIALILLLPLIVQIENYAVIALAIVLEQILISIFLLGQNSAILRYYPRFREKEKILFLTVCKKNIKTSLPFLSIIGIVIISLYLVTSDDDYIVYFISLLCVPMQILMELYLVFLRVTDRVKMYLKIRIIFQISKLLLAVLLASSFLEKFSYSISVFISLVILLLIVYYKFNPGLTGEKYRELIAKPLLIFGVPLAVQAVINILYAMIDRYMINILIDKSHVSIYSFSYTIATSLLFIANVFVLTYLPKIYKNDNGIAYSLTSLKIMLAKVLLIMTLVASFIYIILYPMIIEFYDERYLQGKNVVLLIMFSMIFHVGYLYSFYKLTLLKDLKRIPYVAMMTLIVNVIFNNFLIPILGIDGAAIATIASEALLCFLMYTLSCQSHKKIQRANYNES